MKILVIESDQRAGGHTIDALQRAGHEVIRCHEPALGPFPCNALMPGGTCAVEDESLALAVLVRSHPWPRPTPLENGVTCALRHHLPLVVVGRTILNPYEPWCSAAFDGIEQAIGSLEEIASAPLPRLAEALAQPVAEVLEAAGYDRRDVTVEGRRAGRRRLLAVVRTAHAIDKETVEAIVVAVHRAAKRLDPYAPGIDVEVRPRACAGS